MFYTGEDIPKSAICLAGKNFLESIQKIDSSKHPEVRIEVKTNSLGWTVTNIHTVFGDLQFKREPTLDRIGYSNSAAILGENRLVHYSRTSEHTFNERIDGQEATPSGIIMWDGLALKGDCHIWVNGEGTPSEIAGAGSGVVPIIIVDCTEAPDDLVDGMVYFFQVDCTLTDSITALSGEMWRYSNGSSTRYNGLIPATYRTDNPAIQLLIESSELYRKGYIKLAKVHERPGESAVSVYRGKSAASSGKKSSGSTVGSTGGLAIVRVSDEMAARNYLKEKYGIPNREVLSQKKLDEAASSKGIKFVVGRV